VRFIFKNVDYQNTIAEKKRLNVLSFANKLHGITMHRQFAERYEVVSRHLQRGKLERFTEFSHLSEA